MEKRFAIFAVLVFVVNVGFGQNTLENKKDTLAINHLIYSFDTTNLHKLKARLESEIYSYGFNSLQKSRYTLYTFDNWTYPNSEVWFLTHLEPGDNVRFYKPLLMTFQKIEKDVYKAQVAFYYNGKNGGFYIGNIYNFFLKFEFNDFYFFPTVDFMTKDWREQIVGNVRFKYKPNHNFNAELANQTDSFNTLCSELFDIPSIQLEYFIFDTTDEMYTCLGYDYCLLQINTNQTGGVADIHNNKVYAGNKSEWYPHELSHLYTYQKFKENGYNNINNFFIEGISTWLGGSTAKSLKEHTHLLKETLKNEKIDIANIKLGDLLNAFKPSATTNAPYTLGGLICKYVVERYGKDALWQVIQNTETSEKMAEKIAARFNIKEETIGQLFLELIDHELR